MSEAVTAFLVAIAVISLIGNILVVLLFIKRRKWLKKAHSCLILALAIQDVLLAIGLLILPSFVQSSNAYDVPSNQILRSIYCSLLWSQYFPFALGITSIYTCLMLTIDRWFAVLKPMSYRRLMHSPIVISVMMIIPWIAGFGFEISTPLSAKSKQKDDGSYVCFWKIAESSATKTSLAIFSLLGMIIIPGILMAMAYVQIIVRIKGSSSRISSSVQFPVQAAARRPVERFRSLKRLTKMALGASVIMIVCWLPDQIYYALFQLGRATLGTTTHDAFKILAFANSCMNPFLYSFSNKVYRREFKAILFLPFVKEKFGIPLSRDIECNSLERRITARS